MNWHKNRYMTVVAIALIGLLIAIWAIDSGGHLSSPSPSPPVTDRNSPNENADVLLGFKDTMPGAVPLTVAPIVSGTVTGENVNDELGTLLVSVVEDNEGSAPISGLSVIAQVATGGQLCFRRSHDSDSSGMVKLERLRPGTWLVSVDRGTSELVYLRSAETQEVTLRVGAGKSIVGTVTNVNGEPVGGADVWLSEAGGHIGGLWGSSLALYASSFKSRLWDVRRRVPTDSGDPLTIGWGSILMRGSTVATTNEDGEFVLTRIPEGRLVGAYAQGYQASDLALVDELGKEQRVTLILTNSGARIHGKLVDENEEGIAGASVVIGSWIGNKPWRRERGRIIPPPRPRFLVTDADGLFDCYGLRPGKISVLHSARGYAIGGMGITLDEGETKALKLVATRGHTLSGIVRGASGSPISGARVEAIGPLSAWVTSGSNGYYAIPDLSSGQLVVRAEGPKGAYVTDILRIADDDVEWSPTLNRDASISGIICDSSGRGLQGLVVAASPVDGSSWQKDPSGALYLSGTVEVGPDGTFVIPNCNSGNYNLEVRNYLTSGVFVACGKVWDAAPGSWHRIVVYDEDQYMTGIELSVIDPNGDPVVGALVTFTQVEGRKLFGRRPREHSESVTTDSAGLAWLNWIILRRYQITCAKDGYGQLVFEADLRRSLPPLRVTGLGSVIMTRD